MRSEGERQVAAPLSGTNRFCQHAVAQNLRHVNGLADVPEPLRSQITPFELMRQSLCRCFADIDGARGKPQGWKKGRPSSSLLEIQISTR